MSVVPESVEMPQTYEVYLAEGEINRRYDILDGIRHFMTNPTGLDQVILLSIGNLLKLYERRARAGRVSIAPCDVLIQRHPLRTRQPAVLFMSSERSRAARSRAGTRRRDRFSKRLTGRVGR